MIPVLPTAYFGSIAYFQELARHDEVFIEAKEYFPKQTYRNRCDILGGDGVLSLSIPVKKPAGSKTRTDEVLLSHEENWRMRHWRSFKSAYQASPYFDHYGVEIHDLLFSEEKNIIEFNTTITKRIIDWLDLKTELTLTSEFQKPVENDLRETLVAKGTHRKKQKAPYIQVFHNENNFRKSLSVLDAILCTGPMARNLIMEKH
jgi:hypothetical protein